MAECVDLNGTWEFAAAPRRGRSGCGRPWRPATVPGCVHTDLLADGAIPDPFHGTNEADLRWVEEADWTYRRSFAVDPGLLDRDCAWELVCEGLDTVADLRLNGQRIGSADNMFHAHRFPVSRPLRADDNELRIRFRSADAECARRRRAHDLNRDPALALPPDLRRAYLRKAQYSFGWDWGPRFPTCGIWRPIYLRAVDRACIAGVRAWPTIIGDGGAAVAVDVDAEVRRAGPYRVEARLERGGTSVTRRFDQSWDPGARRGRCLLELPKAEIWWPRGYGEQPLYDLVVLLRDQAGRIQDTWVERIGIREVTLDQPPDPDGNGAGFVVRVNRVPVFCKGANWIPADSFLPRVSPSRYRDLVRLAADANMNMLRVWGGGVYEDDAFYDACDELGILVWQDFMFACAPYPETDGFLASVRTEAEAVVRRLRNHPSVALWCGNNENDWIFRGWDENPDRPYGRAINHGLLPDVCGDLDSTRPYWPSSPAGGDDPNSAALGDRHNWDVWSGWQEPDVYRRDHGRFLSEFGFQGPPAAATLRDVLPESEQHPLSRTLAWHEKQHDGIERLHRYLAGHLPVPSDLDTFVHHAQVNQADAVACGVDHWRRRKFATAGTLFWQFNDCWPVVSWSCVDGADRPKALWYAARRFYADLRVAWVPDDRGRFEAWAIFDGRGQADVEVDLRWITARSRVRWSQSRGLRLRGDRARRVGRVPEDVVAQWDPSEHIAVARLTRGGAVVSRDVATTLPFKHMRVPAPRIRLTHRILRSGTVRVSLRSDAWAKGVEVHAAGFDADWSDNFLDLLPGETRTVDARPCEGIDPATFAASLDARWIPPITVPTAQ